VLSGVPLDSIIKGNFFYILMGGNNHLYQLKKPQKRELKLKISAIYGIIIEYYLYLCRPIYIVLLWESLINIR
ncbi:MAG: hypothetical protein Q4D36_03295, partial [Bacteroidales bacterium]|nr:hypothetical protein [Bacteroidales bacterium]